MASHDVIVVGAGPAGSLAAYRLASAGRKVLLLDKARFPRDKPCGGGVTIRALRQLPFGIDPVVEGVVDLAFEEDSNWTVVDFKTDQEIETDQLQAYLRQVALYAAAIGRATSRPAAGVLLRL